VSRPRSATLGRELPGRLTAPVVAAAFAALVLLERWRPLRRTIAPKLRRNVRNLAMAGLSAATIQLAERPVARRLAARAHRRAYGIVPALALPPWIEVAVTVVLLDYTLFVWHVLTHRVPFLWRFHEVHHADQDLDASTALRFHFAEMLLSVPWRVAQIAVVGAAPLALSAWQTLTLLAILFHHSNVCLPAPLERRLCRVVMTPRLHGIHHSVARDETDSNWGTILSVPDHLHGTARLGPRQAAITIGTPTRRVPDERGFLGLLRRPRAGDFPAPPNASRLRECARSGSAAGAS
jgi:sterol desaturase/sphingolipid hydroxylase (fatty acid hydroxylase superfamily)